MDIKRPAISTIQTISTISTTNDTIIPLSDAAAWNEAVRSCDRYDVYHLAEYVAAETPFDSGEAVLLVADGRDSGTRLVLPLRLRPVNEVPAIRASGRFGDDVLDAISPYGYPGPIVATTSNRVPQPSSPPTLQPSNRLPTILAELGVVSAFIRMHPLIDTASHLPDGFRVDTVGRTVALDLTLRDEEHAAQTPRAHRDDLSRLDRLSPVFDERDGSFAPGFAEEYRAAMRRKDADVRYLFSDAYFAALSALPGRGCRYFSAHAAGGAALALILTCGGAAHYHLATSTENSPSGLPRWLLDRIRIRLTEEGFATLHLGGGVGAADDSLFRFKSGFSKWRPEFRVAKWIGNRDLYAQLCEISGVGSDDASRFFPAYRAPVTHSAGF